MLSGEEKQKAPSVTPPLSWTRHYKRPWVGSFVLLNAAQWKLQTSLREIYHWILTMSCFFYSRQPWILKVICCDLLPERWLQGSGTASLFFFCFFLFLFECTAATRRRRSPVCQLRRATNQGICSLETSSAAPSPWITRLSFCGFGQMYHVSLK